MGIFDNPFDLLGTAKKVKNFDKMNNLTTNVYRDYMMNMCIGRFTWETEVPELAHKTWYYERMLAENGCIVLTKHPETGKYLLLKGYGIGKPTLYGDWDQYQLTGENGYVLIVNREDCVPCWNTLTRQYNTSFSMINGYADRISDAQRTADVRMIHHKAPVILSGSRKLLASMREFIHRLKTNQESILVDEDFPNYKQQEIHYDAAFINHDLMDYITQLFKQFFMMQGINYNAESGKKERLVANEVNANNEQIFRSRYIYMRPRKDFMEEAKKKFGIDINITYEEPENGGVENADDNSGNSFKNDPEGE